MFPFFPVWSTCCSSCTAPSAWLTVLFCSRANSTGPPVRNSSKNNNLALYTLPVYPGKWNSVETRNSLLTETQLVTVFSKGCWTELKLICFGGILKGKGTQELLHNAKFYCTEIFVSMLPKSIKKQGLSLCCVVSFGDFFSVMMRTFFTKVFLHLLHQDIT